SRIRPTGCLFVYYFFELVLKPMRAQCIRMITLLLGGMHIYATVECYLNKTSSTWHAEAV
ncbi:hypothetical protein, partial [Uruburuella suis]|uniref:hypothetical protein n=1 Tax=Uruburuella suis TaxID=252130 RepID=UPI003F4A9A1C